MRDNYTVVITTKEGQITLGFDLYENVGKFVGAIFSHCTAENVTVIISSEERF